MAQRCARRSVLATRGMARALRLTVPSCDHDPTVIVFRTLDIARR
jgi:hypothetical protein